MKKNIKLLLYCISIYSLLLVSGCTSISSCKGSFNQDLPHTDIISALPLRKHIDDMALELYPAYGGGNIVITDFVNTSTYKTSSAGILMAEMLKSSITNKTNARVLQLDFGRSFKLENNGLTALTRNVKDIIKGTRPSASIALVGSYNIINNSLYLFVKRINIRTGSIIHGVSRKLSYSCFGDFIIDTTINQGNI